MDNILDGEVGVELRVTRGLAGSVRAEECTSTGFGRWGESKVTVG